MWQTIRGWAEKCMMGDCLHFRSKTSSSNDVGRAKALVRGRFSACSTAFSGSASRLVEQCSWMSKSASKESDANLRTEQFQVKSVRLNMINKGTHDVCVFHLSLFVDVSARGLGSSSMFFLLIFLCLTVPLSDFPLGSSVKPTNVQKDS